MGAFPTDTLTGAGGALDAFINEHWSPDILNFAKEKRQFSLFFTDRSDELAGGGDTIHVGTMSEMTANSKTSATVVTLNTVTDANVDLVVNTWYETSFAVEDGTVAKFLKSRYTQENYARNAGYTSGAVLENAIAALFGTFTDSVGASTAVVLDSDIRKAIGIIETNTKEEVTDGNFRFFFDTKVWWNQIAGITTYQLKINATADPVTMRPITKLYGVEVLLSNRIPYVSSTTGRYNAIAHKEAIHFAITPLPGQGSNYVRVQSNYIAQYLSTVTTADIQYGVAMARVTYGVNILSAES